MARLTQHREILLLLLITAFGALLRLHRLGELPPGDGHDVAQYGVDALHILSGARPIFFESNFGRESLFSYLVALVFQLTGPGTFGIHLTSALIGILTIPAVYLAGRELFAADRGNGLAFLPLLAAFLSAVSYWHLNWSRLGLRVILVPLLAALIFFALFRGLRLGRRHWFVLAGALAGLSLYTYQAARILPVLLAAAFVLHALLRRRWTQADTINAVLTFGFMALIFAPLGVYAWQHPGALSVRIRQAAVVGGEQPLGEQARTLAEQAGKTLLSFSLAGDTDPQFNIEGRPTLNPVLSLGFYVGIAVALWRFRRSPYLFLLLWLGLMSAPAMIADQAAMAKRYLGAFPAAMLLIALGFLVPFGWLRERTRGPGRPTWLRAYAFLLAIGLAFTTWLTWHDYFVVWANDPDLPAHFQADHREIGRAIGQIDRQQTVWLSPYVADHPVIQFHAGLRPALRGYNGRFCTPYTDPVGDAGATYFIVPGFQDNSLTSLQAIFPAGTTADGPLRSGTDQPYYRAFHAPPGATAGDPIVPLVVWGEEIALLAFAIEPIEAAPGEAITVTLTYRAQRDVAADYTAFVHLLGAPQPASGSPLWAQSDNSPCGGTLPTGRWLASDHIRDTIVLQLPGDLPEGEYELVTGFYTWPELVRLTTESGADVYRFGTVRVTSR